MTDPSYYLVQSEIMRAAFDSGPDAIIVVDTAGMILAVNEQAELLTGRPRADLLGKPIEMLVPEDLRDRHRGHRAGYLRGPYRRLMGPTLELAIMQRTEGGEVAIPVDVNLAPSVISVGTIVVATIRTRGSWGGTESR